MISRFCSRLLCQYRIVPIEKDHGPYARHAEWADLDIEHAAALMRQAYEEREATEALGRQAQRDIRDLLHPTVIAPLVRAHLQTLTENTQVAGRVYRVR